MVEINKEWLDLNAKLQTKKSALRKSLAERGILKREGKNDYDKYKYFSEAQYKELFTRLFSENKLELKFNEVEYETFDGSDKQKNGRFVKVQYTLMDTETGFYEDTIITGEAVDKGDKAGYKAYTGSLKYYLANTFMVATGDEAEKESPEVKIQTEEKRALSHEVAELGGKLGMDAQELAAKYKLNSKTSEKRLREVKAALEKQLERETE